MVVQIIAQKIPQLSFTNQFLHTSHCRDFQFNRITYIQSNWSKKNDQIVQTGGALERKSNTRVTRHSNKSSHKAIPSRPYVAQLNMYILKKILDKLFDKFSKFPFFENHDYIDSNKFLCL